MALPQTFASKTEATGAQLDENFAALGALVPIPCLASGDNTVTITPLANTPTVAAYSNYMQFTGISAAGNNGPATGKVGSLASLPIYKFSPAGPVLLSGGEMVANVAFTWMYDSALNGGNGGFHLMDAAAVTGAGGTITGPLVGSGSLAVLSFPLASITRLSIGANGNTITRNLRVLSSSLSFAALLPGTGTTASISMPGCSINDIVSVGAPAAAAASIGIMYRGIVVNDGTVSLLFFNASTGTVSPVGGTYGVEARGYS